VVYSDNGEGKKVDLAPAKQTGLTLLLDSSAVNSSWLSDGFFAQALQDTTTGDIIIAFEASNLDLKDKSAYAVGSRNADKQILLGITPQAFYDATTFVQDVEQYLTEHNLEALPVYVTGHSLGGAEAEFVASTDGLSGVTFGAPGSLVATYGNPRAGQSFVNYVDWGDPVGNFGFHFGSVKQVGPAADAVVAATLEQHLGPVAGTLAAGALFHPLDHYAIDLRLSQTADAGHGTPIAMPLGTT
jgi:hypothetical protein